MLKSVVSLYCADSLPSLGSVSEAVVPPPVTLSQQEQALQCLNDLSYCHILYHRFLPHTLQI